MNSKNAINDGIFHSTNRGSFSMSFIILPDYFCQCDKSQVTPQYIEVDIREIKLRTKTLVHKLHHYYYYSD